MAIKLNNGKIITGKETELLSAPSAMVINAIKVLSKIPDDIDLLSPYILEPILKQRKNHKRPNEQTNRHRNHDPIRSRKTIQ